MNNINGGVCAAKGFKAYGLRAGIKAGKTNKDMALVYSEVPATVAGTFTLNKVQAAPVKWDKYLVENFEKAQAIIINSGVANACTGQIGIDNTEKTAQFVADEIGIKKYNVLVASTGVIGAQLPMDAIEKGIKDLVPKVTHSEDAAQLAAEAIMTTDTISKQTAVEFTVDNKTSVIGGMCKGSGMIHPNMGTMLGFITTDVLISKDLLQEALLEVVNKTFNMVSVDGDTSTNDSVLVLANGLTGNAIINEKNDDYYSFLEALNKVCLFFAQNIAADGEGATKLFEVNVVNAKSYEDAKLLSKSIACSSLTKAALFGMDANWGRILCAMGYSGADFDPEKVDITIESEFGKINLVENGMASDYSEDEATKVLSSKKVIGWADCKQGNEKATAWGCDLTYDYVKINGDYRS